MAWGLVLEEAHPPVASCRSPVFTPTLTGLEERANLINPQINLDTHIQDVTTVLEYEDLQNVVLVGHSYGGMVISGVEAKAGERLAQLVYLDAFLPEDGKVLQDYARLWLKRCRRKALVGACPPPGWVPQPICLVSRIAPIWPG